jgi:toxin ParE1/3/4
VIKPVVLSTLAQSDLREIVAQSRQAWGKVQATRYASDIAAALKKIGAHPDRYPLFGAERPDVRRLRSGRHILFYREDAEAVAVLRILHERMDHERHL